MSRFFTKRELVLWLHPLGLIYATRIAETGYRSGVGPHAIISLGTRGLVCVPQSDLVSISELEEINPEMLAELKKKSSRETDGAKKR